jgi:hypothetical protein
MGNLMSGATVAARPGGDDVADWHQPAWRRQLADAYARYGALLGYLVATLAIYVGWSGRDERNINAEYGLGYALGIVGGLLMLLLLLYSVRKRVRFLARFGATSHWFRAHMILGIVGPVLILYHCNFELGDLNSEVALICTLLVAGSGVVGRYLYAGIHQGLYGRRADLRELVDNLANAAGAGRLSGLLDPIRAELTALDRRVLTPPASVLDSLLLPWTIGWQTRSACRRLVKATRRELMKKAMTSPAVDQHADRLEQSVSRYLREHMAQVRQVARFNSFERLFSLWHVVHVPFFLMMIFSAIFHVFAVHLF